MHLPGTFKLNTMSSLLKEIQIYSNLSIQNCPNKYSSKNVFPTVGIPTSIQIGDSWFQSLKNPSSKFTNFDPLLKTCISPLHCLFKSQVCLPHWIHQLSQPWLWALASNLEVQALILIAVFLLSFFPLSQQHAHNKHIQLLASHIHQQSSTYFLMYKIKSEI